MGCCRGCGFEPLICVWKANGCILDQMEKVCEGEAEEMMAPNAQENLWMCCALVTVGLVVWPWRCDSC